MISPDHEKVSVHAQCQLLDLQRSSVLYKPAEVAIDPLLMNEIHELWLKCPFYGYRRIAYTLNARGYTINHKRALRIMRLMNLQAIYPKKRLSTPNRDNAIYPYLLRDLVITKPNQVWASDITYIKTARGFVYLVCLIDVFSRYIVAWELSNCLSADFCISMLNQALISDQPEIINTDQGSQFTSQGWVNSVTSKGIQVSMDGAGRCLDNIYIERFWRTLKYENVNLMAYETVREAHNGIGEFIEFYNNERLHSSLGYATPARMYDLQKPEFSTENLFMLNQAPEVVLAPNF